MNTCPARLQSLPCSMRGYGYLSDPVRQSDNTLRLMKGQGAYFPELVGDQFFFVTVEGCDGCCEHMRVVARDGDTLTVERTSRCDCINSNARVAYDYNSKEYIQAAAREIGLNVKAPLLYDCESNTISLDCNALGLDSDCGCGSGKGGAGTGGRGEKGEAGRNGVDGVSVVSISIDEANKLTWTDSTGATKTIGTIQPPKGQKGDKGDRGDVGPQGPEGPKGDALGTLSMTSNEDGSQTIRVTNADGETSVVGSWTPPRGVGVQSATVNEAGELIVTLTDNTQQNAGAVRGVGVTGAAFNEKGELVLTLSNGQQLNAGVPPAKAAEAKSAAGFSFVAIDRALYISGPVGAQFDIKRGVGAGGAGYAAGLVIPANGVYTTTHNGGQGDTLLSVVSGGVVVALGVI